MAKTVRIPIRVTKIQYERAKNDAQVRGFNTLSAYLRSLMFSYDFSVERKIDEMYRIITREGNGKKERHREIPLTAYI